MSDTMEAILGAVAEDGGVDVLRGVMRHLGLLILDEPATGERN